MTPDTRSSIANAVIYQVGWFACVLGGAYGFGTAGAGLALVLAAAHVAFAERPDLEWPLLASAAVIGIVVDTAHGALGVLEFRGHVAGAIAPLWIIALWIQFGTVLHFCMRWLSGRYLLAALLGLVGGPLAFLGGERMGAVAFGAPRELSLAVVAIAWAVSLPVLVGVADWLAGPGRYRLAWIAGGGEETAAGLRTARKPG